jgi:hypothetical protein
MSKMKKGGTVSDQLARRVLETVSDAELGLLEGAARAQAEGRELTSDESAAAETDFCICSRICQCRRGESTPKQNRMMPTTHSRTIAAITCRDLAKQVRQDAHCAIRLTSDMNQISFRSTQWRHHNVRGIETEEIAVRVAELDAAAVGTVVPRSSN